MPVFFTTVDGSAIVTKVQKSEEFGRATLPWCTKMPQYFNRSYNKNPNKGPVLTCIGILF